MDEVKTSFKVLDGESGMISFKSGVKQGDPLSPLIFNILLNPLMNELVMRNNGFETGESNLGALAFADDLAIVSKNWEAMQLSLEIMEAFCELTSLKVQGKKCHGVIAPGGESYVVNNCQDLSIAGEQLYMIDPGKEEKYLGVNLDPWSGVFQLSSLSKVETWLVKIDRAPLKPEQKLDILKLYLLPRLLYQADHLDTLASVLSPIDDIIHNFVKKWLLLPACTTNGLFYSQMRDGGLGIVQLEKLIPQLQMKRLFDIALSEDVLLEDISRCGGLQEKVNKIWTRNGGLIENVPDIFCKKELGKFEDLKLLVDYRDSEFERWTSLVC